MQTHLSAYYLIARLSKIVGYAGKIKMVFEPGIKKIPKIAPSAFLEIDHKVVPFYVEEFEILDDRTALIKLENINDKDEAKKYLGTGVWYPKDQLKSEPVTNLPAAMLTGYKLFDQNNKFIGTILSVNITSGHINLEVEMDTKLVLVPFHENLLIKADPKKQEIQLQIAEGLLEM